MTTATKVKLAGNGTSNNSAKAHAPVWPTWSTLSPRALADLDAAYGWSLDADELKTVQAHFIGLKREPVRAEIETLAQTWSEHCSHKTFRSAVKYKEGRSTKRFKNLLKETIMEPTKKLKKKWCLSVFEDNAGIIAFDKKWALAYKVETHNHPCAVEPYGGAETGVGGVIRDILGAGLGAKPVMNTDVFCFCPPDYKGYLPEGILHPRRTMSSVVEGVRDYGNRMGIPTAAGAIWFDEAYKMNPLVFVGTIGIMPRSAVKKSIHPGDLIVAVGGKTGRDGLHGATFSSAAIDDTTSTSAVQVGHAIEEKRLLDALLKARDKNLYRGLTDCGAGGFSSAIGEMASLSGRKGGACVRLDAAALKTSDLSPWEIWVSESQERMVLAVPKKNLRALQGIFAGEGSEVSVLGEFTNTGCLEVSFGDETLVNLDLKFLHDGNPQRERNASFTPPPKNLPKKVKRSEDRSKITEILHWSLANLNTCSREWVIRQYDHEVQGGTVIKPLQGLHHDGPGDAPVLWPGIVTGEVENFKGFTVGHGLNPSYGKLDPYAMALIAVDEALGNLVCVGGDPTKAALLDNFCWGDVNDPEQLGGLVRAALGCKDAALGFQTPFISGKDSLHNVYTDAKGKKHSIPGTLLISAIAPVDDIRKAVTMDFKAPNNPVFLVGPTNEDFGGSLYEQWKGTPQGAAPQVNIKTAKKTLWTLSAAIRKGLVFSAHNLSEGGLAVAAAEMAIAGDVSIDIDLDDVTRSKNLLDNVSILFTESPSRFLVEVKAEKEKAFLKAMRGAPLCRIGQTIANPVLRVTGLDGTRLLEESLHDLKKSWQGTLPRMLEGESNDKGRNA
ncbi:MAG: phosphoribosylformylglycinamidine synthase subunit PurL [Elusimicrobia bacterium]|nr:MAG: phosphoribosylformylglycinamidine synthase subunit PurL [Elusimicrobiota bacterium]